MVLHGWLCGRVDRCRLFLFYSASSSSTSSPLSVTCTSTRPPAFSSFPRICSNKIKKEFWFTVELYLVFVLFFVYYSQLILTTRTHLRLLPSIHHTKNKKRVLIYNWILFGIFVVSLCENLSPSLSNSEGRRDLCTGWRCRCRIKFSFKIKTLFLFWRSRC